LTFNTPIPPGFHHGGDKISPLSMMVKRTTPVFTLRRATVDDIAGMVDLVLRVRRPSTLAHYPTTADIEELSGQPETLAHAVVCLRGKQMAGFAWLHPQYGNLTFDWDATLGGTPALEMLNWAIRTAKKLSTSAEELILSVGCRQSAAARRAVLQQAGFQPGPDFTLHFTARPTVAPPKPPPPGYSVRQLAGPAENPACVEVHPAAIDRDAGPAEIPACVEVHRAAFDSDEMTSEYFQAMLATSAYDPQLHLVVAAPDGSLAGYCLAGLEPATRGAGDLSEAHTDPVAVHPLHQGRGLARCLLSNALHLLHQRGVQRVHLGTAGDNLPMQHAALAAGFEETDRTIFYERES